MKRILAIFSFILISASSFTLATTCSVTIKDIKIKPNGEIQILTTTDGSVISWHVLGTTSDATTKARLALALTAFTTGRPVLIAFPLSCTETDWNNVIGEMSFQY